MVPSAFAAAVTAGAVGGVVVPVYLPPSKTPPVPLQLMVGPPYEQVPAFAPLLAQSNEAPGRPSNPTLAGWSSSRNGVTPGVFTLAVPNATTASASATAREILAAK